METSFSNNDRSEVNNFDRIAPIYDLLAKLVFGNALKRAQTEFLHLIQPNSKVLVLGGGTGWIIQEILNREKSVEIFYLEKSQKMIEIAQQKVREEDLSKIRFIWSDIESWNSNDVLVGENTNKGKEDRESYQKYDAILCNFFLDVFEEEKLKRIVLPKIKGLLSDTGVLLASDFQNTSGAHSFWQKPLLWVMHQFFGIFCGLESQKLSDIPDLLEEADFKPEDEKAYFGGVVFSRMYFMGKA